LPTWCWPPAISGDFCSYCVFDRIKAKHNDRGPQKMNRNILYLVIGALAAVVAVLSYQFYQQRQKTTGVEISIGERGISIEKK
jgi:hypothetical protein